jgi:hypothetical protein
MAFSHVCSSQEALERSTPPTNVIRESQPSVLFPTLLIYRDRIHDDPTRPLSAGPFRGFNA